MLWNLGRAVLLCMLCSRYIHCMENDGEAVDQTSGDDPGSSADNGQSSADVGQSSINDQQSMDYQDSSTGGPQPIIDVNEDQRPIIDDKQICDIILQVVIEEMHRFSCSIERDILEDIEVKECGTTLERTVNIPDLNIQIDVKGCLKDPEHVKFTFATSHNTLCEKEINQGLEMNSNGNVQEGWIILLSREDCFISPSTRTLSKWSTTQTTNPSPRTRPTTTDKITSYSTSSSTSDTAITHGIDPNSDKSTSCDSDSTNNSVVVSAIIAGKSTSCASESSNNSVVVSAIIADKSTSCDSDSSNNSIVVSAIIAGFVSFIAGILTTLLLIWLLCSKRRPGLCYQHQPEKTPERMTSDKVTKKILAKHLLSDRKEPTAPENKVYFVNESGSKQGPDDTEGMYNDIDQGGQLQGVYTTIQTSGTTPSSPPTEEHVYRDLDLDRSADTENNEKKVKINYINDNNETQKEDGTVAARYKAETDMFDHARESIVSGHDYFVLQNDNFRPNSEQADRTPSGMDPGYTDENAGNVDNEYFVLEKQN